MLTVTDSTPDFAALFFAIPRACIALDTSLAIIAANDAYLAATERTADELVGKNVFTAFPENLSGRNAGDPSPARVSFETVLRTRAPCAPPVFRYDIPRRPERGGGVEQRFWRMTSAPVLDETGALRWIVNLVDDVTAEMRRQNESDARWRAATRAADLGSWEYEPATGVVRRSKIVDDLFGLAGRESEIASAVFFDRIHAEDRATVAKLMHELLDGPERSDARFDYRVVRPDGSVRWALSRAEVLRDGDLRKRLIGVSMDVTADREREMVLREALREREALLSQKDMLLREVNHRVKNSLQLVASLLQIQAHSAAPSVRAQFEMAAARVMAITAVHERLYKSDRIQSVEISQYLRDLCQDIATAASRGDGEWRIEVDADELELATDQAVPLALVSNELVINAVKHAYPEQHGGWVGLSLRRGSGGNLCLTVRDRGVGCDPPATTGQNVFQEEDNDPGTASTGLGLRLIQTLSRQLRGTIDRRNLNPGCEVVLEMRGY